MTKLKDTLRYNRRDTEYHDCVNAIKTALMFATENSLNEDLKNMLTDVLADAKGFHQSELDDIINGF